MQYQRNNDRVDILLEQNLNLAAANKILFLARKARKVHIDLSAARIVDTEGIILIFRLLKAGKQLELYAPPPVLGELVAMLGLEQEISIQALKVSHSPWSS